MANTPVCGGISMGERGAGDEFHEMVRGLYANILLAVGYITPV